MPAFLGLRSMANTLAILILENGHGKMVNPGTDMDRPLHGKGARVLDLIKTPPRHLAVTVDESGVATEADGSAVLTIAASPRCEETPVLIKETADMEPSAGRPASSNAAPPAPMDAHAYMMSQDTRGISHSINEETPAYAIQSM
eukprot:7766048-Pyramimonas_sp.AAC.1